MKTNREVIEEIGAFPNDPTGLRREFAIKFHRGDFYDAKKDKEWDNSEMISDWWLEQLHQELQKAREEEGERVVDYFFSSKAITSMFEEIGASREKVLKAISDKL